MVNDNMISAAFLEDLLPTRYIAGMEKIGRIIEKRRTSVISLSPEVNQKQDAQEEKAQSCSQDVSR